MEQLLNRMIGAAKLDKKTYEEIEHDKTATGQAVLVVVIVAIASGVGTIGGVGLLGLLWGILISLFGWAVFAGLVYWIGTTFLPKPETKADWGELARVLAFARAPGVLAVFGIIGLIATPIASLIFLIILVWTVVASVIAVREALDYGDDWVRALAVVILAFIPAVVIQAIVLAIV